MSASEGATADAEDAPQKKEDQAEQPKTNEAHQNGEQVPTSSAAAEAVGDGKPAEEESKARLEPGIEADRAPDVSGPDGIRYWNFSPVGFIPDVSYSMIIHTTVESFE